MEWILPVAVLVCLCGQSLSKSMWDEIQMISTVRWMARKVEDFRLTDMFLDDNITVFLPSNDAYYSFTASRYGYNKSDVNMWRSLLLYSSVQGSLLMENIQDKQTVSTRLGDDYKLYFNKYTDGDEYPIINGARVVDGDIQTENGVLHIIDRLLAPAASPHTVAQYLETPEIPRLSFTSIIRAKIVIPELEAETRNASLKFTSFAPNDSFLFAMPLHGKDKLFSDWQLLENVYRAHIVPYDAYFLPTKGHMPNIEAATGTLSFTRYNGEMYVYNNLVRARIVQPNIPVVNGVIHVVDDLLFFIYDNVVQRLAYMPETSKLSELVDKLPRNMTDPLTKLDQNFTVFAPTDWAFAKIPLSQQQELNRVDDEGSKILKYLLDGHIIPGQKLDAETLSQTQTLRTIDNRTINVIHRDGDIFLESGAVRARVEVTNIGCTNGIIHFISNVLFFRNFTIWEAIENIPELSIMHSFALQYPDVEEKLSSESGGALTMFIATNSVVQTPSQSALVTLNSFPYIVHQALRGQIVQGQFSSSSIDNSIQVGTMAGKSLRIYKEKIYRSTGEEEVLMVEGTHVKARVIVKDIWCSNGVLHIVDDILHVAIRNIMDEMGRRSEISFTNSLFSALKVLDHQLSNLSKSFMVFAPHNDAYSKLPWASVNALFKNVNKTIELLKAHIVTGEAKFISELSDRQMLVADKNVIYIIKKAGNVYAVNNNMWAKVIVPDIPASNGHIHIVDTMVYRPYKTVSEMLDSTDELRPFYNMMMAVPAFNTLVNSGERTLTMFAPSAGFLDSLNTKRLLRIQNSTDILKKLFLGHVLPSVRLDDEFLRRFPGEHYVSRSSLATITLRRSGEDTYVDAGYEPLYIDLIGRGHGCSNGVIYIIDGFLNYSPYNIMERLQGDNRIQNTLRYMMRLINYTVIDELSRDDLTFTFLIPLNKALHKLEYEDIATLDNFPMSERLKVFWRHVINGTEASYDDLRQGNVRPDALPDDVVLETNSEGVFFKWRHVRAKVVESDKLASNGVIHILDTVLFTTSDPETTSTSTTTTTTTTTLALPVGEAPHVLQQPCLIPVLVIISLTFSLCT